MLNPVSTYRLQFHKGFTFTDLERILPYLKKLGISTIYASPVFESVSGSIHGYDSVNPLNINPEIGTIEQFTHISKNLKDEGINWLQDIVPNHMAYHPDNNWLMDVLEKGPLSVYEKFFDLPRTCELYHGRIMVPFLGSPLDEVIEDGELKIAYEKQRLVFKYYHSTWPLNLLSYETILKCGSANPNEAIQQLITQIHQIHEIDDPKAFSFAMDEFRLQLASLTKDPVSNKYLSSCLLKINNQKYRLQELADRQIYRLCDWQETDSEINFRRFFIVNGLICLNIHNEEVFQEFHKLIKLLLTQDIIHGLRIDHIDGLFDPATYLSRLRSLSGDETYVVVEKILEHGEQLPQSWPVQGNTGYDFLAIINNLFTEKKSEESFIKFYNTLIGSDTPVASLIREKKEYILYQHMGGELENLYRLFIELSLTDKVLLKNIPAQDLKGAIAEFLVNCPVYRHYGNSLPLNNEETLAIHNIFEKIRAYRANLKASVDLLDDVLLKKPLQNNDEHNRNALLFYQRCMQFTGPLMAKGVEDTLMYSYNRFIGHNEVGDSPDAFGIATEEFHNQMIYRQEKWPLSMNATATHDTKRGEDVRARLNVLTDLADEWLNAVNGWQESNIALKQDNAPDNNDEYFIYQTLIGSYPMPGCDEEDYHSRLDQYIEKAFREAKVHSSWTIPHEHYEKSAKTFARTLLDKGKPFWQSFSQLHRKVSDYGILNSLSQVVMKFTCPGVPDLYQGCELWDLSMVDPDNRRPVNYELRHSWLADLEKKDPQKKNELIRDLWQNRYDGRIKLWFVHSLLKERKLNPEIFEKGIYIPLEVKGKYKEHVLAFARRFRETWYVIAIPLHLARACKFQESEIITLDWMDTCITLPSDAPAEWRHLLLNNGGEHQNEITLNTIFKHIPIAVLNLQPSKGKRSAGILMHITSLPSKFGIGDFGPEARAFAGFLSRGFQSYWQLLPLSPTEMGTGHSPYSSYSSMAGNTLLLSPELLVEEGLLNLTDLKNYQLTSTNKVDYKGAEEIKNQLFETAWSNFRKGGFAGLAYDFDDFCQKESYWLNDFALYVVLKKHNQGNAWYKWPEEYKLRNRLKLEDFSKKNAEAVNKERWLQYLFFKQWKELKAYCNQLNIKLFGDLPFYVSYDSADVWSQPEIFSLDENGRMKGVAGVPPDYFNENGQLWGMPVFRWDRLKDQNYGWWMQRIRKNLELYDLLRLDHFRAFSEYWEVPANEETAKNGKWIQGPGADFFTAAQKEFGSLPFVAEDLGDINHAVHKLREESGLPGMKVLQFAFGDDLANSDYSPHNYTTNYFVYTGTHDNNTIRGWYKQDISHITHKQIEQYTGIPVKEKNIHLVLGRLAYGSVAKTVILPVQDVLGLDENARMNTPASLEKNWLWRLQPGLITAKHENQLREWSRIYNRVRPLCPAYISHEGK